MESECPITPICGVTCGNCPAFSNDSNPTDCHVMNAIIGAYRAQEAYWDKMREKHDLIMNDEGNAFVAQERYWKQKLEIERKGILSQVYDIEKRLDSAERELKEMRKGEQGKGG